MCAHIRTKKQPSLTAEHQKNVRDIRMCASVKPESDVKTNMEDSWRSK